MSTRYKATDEILRESKLQSCKRNNIRHSPEEISVADKKQPRELKDAGSNRLKLSKARGNNDQLCKDEDLLDTHIRINKHPAILPQRDTIT